MRSEHLQSWLAAVTREERPDTENWDRLVDILQTYFGVSGYQQSLLGRWWSSLRRVMVSSEVLVSSSCCGRRCWGSSIGGSGMGGTVP